MYLVISGLISPHLMLKELARQGQISRKWSIFVVPSHLSSFLGFPAHYCDPEYARLGSSNIRPACAAATYTWNYLPWAGGWVIGHCWSLTLEEPVYLLWPVRVIFGRRASLSIAVGIISSRLSVEWLHITLGPP